MEMKINLGKYLTAQLAKKVGKVLYDEAIYPAAVEYVASTDNPFDDSALNFLNGFAEKWLNE